MTLYDFLLLLYFIVNFPPLHNTFIDCPNLAVTLPPLFVSIFQTPIPLLAAHIGCERFLIRNAMFMLIILFSEFLLVLPVTSHLKSTPEQERQDCHVGVGFVLYIQASINNIRLQDQSLSKNYFVLEK